MSDLTAVQNAEGEFEIVVQKVEQVGVQIDAQGRSLLKGIYQNFQGFFDEMAELEAKVQGITVTDVSQTAEMELAKRTRLQLRTIRTSAEKEKDRLKAGINQQANIIDGINRVIRGSTSLLEDRLLEMEKFAERKEAERKAEIRRVRAEALAPYGIETLNMTLEDWSEPFFQNYLETCRVADLAKKEAAAKAEQDRIAREQAETEERGRIREENERLKKEAEAREAAQAAEREAHERELLEAKEKADAELKAAAEKAEAERREAQEKADAERRIAEEKAARERADLEKKAAEERMAREKAEADAKAMREKEEREAKEKAQAEAKAKSAPDKVKLEMLAKIFEAINIPAVSTPQAQAIVDKVKSRIRIMAADIREGTSKL